MDFSFSPRLADLEESAVDRAVRIVGGRGHLRDNPVERLHRVARVDRIRMGTSEVRRLFLADEIDKRDLSGLPRFSTAPGELPGVHGPFVEGAAR
ncbi:acyl-CoA dehydrogenase family protein [Streptomyces brasiliscabiei]|uniref:acyl-CoA dehydrogenase family protein n=1 Tax=Streptomyces brasiliscabiei TaxID=2736302 RepID=UPI001F2F2DB3|nr:acyl-CoA dehydrogenase family protein [Streptomyces brasiliscabiei]